MKKLALTAIALLATLSVYAQGEVSFGNNTATRIMIDKTPVGGAVGFAAAADGIVVGLYWAPLSDPNNFRQLGAAVNVGVPLPGLFSGGTRTTGPETPEGGVARFQVRGWEAAYGSTYEAALAAPAMNGRVAFTGTSTIFEGATGDPPLQTPQPITGMGFQSFTVVVPEPSVVALGLIGAGALLLLRRRK